MVSLQYHICVVYCKEYHLTVSRNKRNDIIFIGKLSLQLICTMFGIPEGTSSAAFYNTVGNTCFMFYTIPSVMLLFLFHLFVL